MAKLKMYRRFEDRITFHPSEVPEINKLPERKLDGGRIEQREIFGKWFHRESENEFSRTLLCRTEDVMKKAQNFIENL